MLVPNIVQFTLRVRKEHWVNSLREPLKTNWTQELKATFFKYAHATELHSASGSQAGKRSWTRDSKQGRCSQGMHLPIVSLFSSHPWWWAAWLRACRCKPGTLPCLRQRLKLCGTGYKGEQAKRAQPVFLLKITRCLVYRNIAGRICPNLTWQAWLSSGAGFIRRDSYSLGCFFPFQNLENGYVLHLWTELKF